MKTVMVVIGALLMSLIVVFETLVKIVWSVIYSIIRPIVKNSRYNDAMYDYAFKWKYNFRICNWIGDLWRD